MHLYRRKSSQDWHLKVGVPSDMQPDVRPRFCFGYTIAQSPTCPRFSEKKRRRLSLSRNHHKYFLLQDPRLNVRLFHLKIATMPSVYFYQSLTGPLYAITATLLAVATIAVVLRQFARKLSTASSWWDDWTLVAALVTLKIFILTSFEYFSDSLTRTVYRCYIMVLPFAIGSKLVQADSVAIPKLWAGQLTTELF